MHHVFDGRRTVIGQLRDVHHAINAGQNFHEGAVALGAHHLANVRLANLDRFGQRLDFTHGQLRAGAIGRRDEDGTVIFDVNLDAVLLLHGANLLAARPNDLTDLLWVHVNGQDSWGQSRQVRPRRGDDSQHLVQNEQAPLTRLLQGLFHDIHAHALDLDIHLQGGDAIFGAGHLEVHVAQGVFHALNVAQHCVAIACRVGDEAHGDACHRRHNRDASIHQRQGAAADGGHRGRAVRREHFRHDTQGVGELVHGRDHGLQRTLGQGAVSNFAALWPTHWVNFAGGVGREVVVMHVALGIFWQQGVERLRLTWGAQRGDRKHLGFAAGEQATAVRARQNADRATDWPDFGGAPTIRA